MSHSSNAFDDLRVLTPNDSITIENHLKKDLQLYNNFTVLLDLNNNWKLVVSELKKMNVSFSDIDNRGMESSGSQYLVSFLESRSCQVKHMCEILKKCKLFEVLALLSDPEQVEIVAQPGENDSCVSVIEGGELTLECIATGLPPPSYLWHRDNTELQHHTKPQMVVHDFKEEDEGEYYCIVKQTVRDEVYEKISNRVICELLPEPPRIISQVPDVSDRSTELSQPNGIRPIKVLRLCGQELVLSVEIAARPQPTYQWIRNNTILEDENASTLHISQVKLLHEGEYRCLAVNRVGEIWSIPWQLTVCMSPPLSLPERGERAQENIASAKIALLIGNQHYENLPNLLTPSNDVATLSEILTKLKFHVITLQNLSLVEMQEAIKLFCRMLPPKTYGVFYYAGHGFHLTDNFMMPVDCPPLDEYRRCNCICNQQLIQSVMRTKPKLLVVILDMCLKTPSRANNPGIYDEKVQVYQYQRDGTCNMVQAFATSSHQSAYERQTQFNGIYAHYLSKYIGYDMPIAFLLQLIHEEYCKREKASKQKPAIINDDASRCRLTDTVIVDSRVDREMFLMNQLQHSTKLNFQNSQLETAARLQLHRGVFLNSIDVLLDGKSLSQCNLSVVINQKEISHFWSKEENELVLTLHNIQKAKSNIQITVFQNKEDSSTGNLTPIDEAVVDIGRPLISSKNLWLSSTQLL